MKGIDIPRRESLQGDINTDVVVIGGGLAGILTAYHLKRNGIDCIVLEASRIGSGQTKNTTAKITIQHELKYSQLIENFGEEKALQYANANRRAIDEYFEIAEREGIDCMLEKKSAYLYSRKESDRLEQELLAAKKLGISAEITNKTALPFVIRGALKFDNQAQFHPLMFLKGISQGINIYENTMVLSIEDDKVITDNGTVTAERVVVATHYPFINVPGYYFMRMHQERSYVIALENAAELDGVYYGIEEGEPSLRNSGSLLLVGGGAHRTGENSAGGKYENLRKTAQKFFPASREVANWSAQDCMPIDSVPYIGQFSSSTPNLFVATGFGKWGMTTSMVSAIVITDLLLGKPHPYEIFSPQRFKPSVSAKSLMDETAHAVKGLSSGIFNIPDAKLSDIPNGHGGLIEHDGEKVGVYKDGNGEVFTVSTRCTHLGCQLEWNPDELSWDCPCHGSRFDYRGDVIDNPAMKCLHEKK